MRAELRYHEARDRTRTEARGGDVKAHVGGQRARALRDEPLGARQEVALPAARAARQLHSRKGIPTSIFASCPSRLNIL